MKSLRVTVPAVVIGFLVFTIQAFASDLLVTDAHGAIVIARAMMLAERPGDPEIRSEAEWLANAKADLRNGVWYITDKKPHKAREGYFIGGAVIKIDARDGRYLGEFFAN